MKNKFKTSTRISIIFSLFTFFIIWFLLIFLNLYLFFSWYNREILEIKENHIITNAINIWYKEIISDEIKNDDNIFLKWLLELDLFEEKEDDLKWYKKIFFNLYIKNKNIFLIYKKENWNFYSPYNVTKYYNDQLQIIKIWLILLILFTLVSYIISKKLFIKLALKDIFYISKELKNINLNNIKKIKLNLDKNDEINIIWNSLNNFLEIIEKNNKSLKQFNSQIAHEFKTPLMIISSELEFLELKWVKSESMKRIEFQISKLDSLLEHFLLLTKIWNWKSIEKKNINLKEIINKNILVLKKIYLEKNIAIKNNINSKININTNEDFFEIIIKNILDNAFKYNKNSWEIIISIENFDPLCLKIKDYWIWIKKENIKKIWDNLYRENQFQKWYWVWLNLVKKICEILNYEIKVESIEWNQTTFLLKIK